VLAEGQQALARTPAVLDAWLRDLDDAWLDCDEGPGTWTPRQVPAHLVHGGLTDVRPPAELLDKFAPARADSAVGFRPDLARRTSTGLAAAATDGWYQASGQGRCSLIR